MLPMGCAVCHAWAAGLFYLPRLWKCTDNKMDAAVPSSIHAKPFVPASLASAGAQPSMSSAARPFVPRAAPLASTSSGQQHGTQHAACVAHLA